MPTLNKLKKPKELSYKLHGKSKDIYKLYNTQTWRRLREGYLMEHPLCENCLLVDKITPAKEVHHIKPISRGVDEYEMRCLAYDPNNLRALCEECHDEEHRKLNKK